MVDNYENLICYAAANDGNCSIPSKYPPNQPLSNWVNTQRMNKKNKDGGKGNMTDEQVQKLENIGFKWNVYSPKKK